MNRSASDNPNIPPRALYAQIDPICDEFEQAWSPENRPAIEEFLDRVDEGIRLELLKELLHIECEFRRKQGEELHREEYLFRFPDDTAMIEGLINTFPVSDAKVSTVVPRQSTVDGDLHGERTLAPNGNPTAAGTPLERFGGYELIEEIARGGMGVVYKARQISLNRIVAVKMILSGQLASKVEVQRFYTEAEAAATLDHPGIVPIYEVGQHNGQHFFSMGFVEGESLAQRVSTGPLDPQLAAKLVGRIAEAVSFAHSRDIIHRDLKPANVLLDKSNYPRITDFGLAKKLKDGAALTATGDILGTPSYMPPEQASGKTNEIGILCDVYSLGAILYCLLVGRPPFQAATAVDTMMQVLEQDPVPPRQLNAAVPGDLDTICLKCLEKDPSRRFQSARELARDLSRFLKGEPIQARRPRPLERAARWAHQHVVLTTVIFLLLMTTTFFFPLFWFVGTLVSRSIGSTQTQSENHETIVGLMDEALLVDPKHVEAYYERAQAHFERGDLQRAIGDLDAALHIDDGFAAAYYLRGLLRGRTGQADLALADLNRAITLDPRLAEAYLERAKQFEANHEFSGALDDLGKVIRLRPTLADAYELRAKLYEIQGDDSKARRDYQSFVKLHKAVELRTRQ